MRTLLKIFFLGVLSVLLSIAAMAEDTVRGTKPQNDRDKNLFVVKADRDLVGARIEILQANGNVIAEQVLSKRKLVIDFNESKTGTYTIRIVKGKKSKEYYYQKV